MQKIVVSAVATLENHGIIRTLRCAYTGVDRVSE